MFNGAVKTATMIASRENTGLSLPTIRWSGAKRRERIEFFMEEEAKKLERERRGGYEESISLSP